ncbi:MAG: NAD(P)-binding domain-containing protein, partial [Gammaproteobacteria bacterium]|nr:NAD(P)-binding domain-containing protein [Gammaproteobacteria bacterium]
RTLGVVGLGAIGVHVANIAVKLGMKVIGYDPSVTVQSAWRLSSEVKQAHNVDELFSQADFVTFHVPLIDATKNILNADRIGKMKKNAVILNFARGGIVDDEAVVKALDAGNLYAYVCDFPSNLLKNHPRTITLPHLGASTEEAEVNCAVMVAEQVKDYLENGNILNSVNFPEVNMPRTENGTRIAVVNSNVPNMVGQISTALAKANLNIIDMLNKSRGEVAYTLIDVDGDVSDAVVQEIRAIKGVLGVRVVYA